MRKKSKVTLEDRGNLVTFRIKEMSALQLEHWMIQMAVLLSGDEDFDVYSYKLAPFLETLLAKGGGWLYGVDYSKLKPLLDEMFDGCTIVLRTPLGDVEQPFDEAVAASRIEDYKTLLALRMEILKVNLGFLMRRRPFDLPAPPCGSKTSSASCSNVSRVMHSIVWHRLATVHELQKIYSYEDALDMMEIIQVSNHNQQEAISRAQARR